MNNLPAVKGDQDQLQQAFLNLHFERHPVDARRRDDTPFGSFQNGSSKEGLEDIQRPYLEISLEDYGDWDGKRSHPEYF